MSPNANLGLNYYHCDEAVFYIIVLILIKQLKYQVFVDTFCYLIGVPLEKVFGHLIKMWRMNEFKRGYDICIFRLNETS